MEGKVKRAPSARCRGSTQGIQRKTRAARTQAPCLISEAAPDLAAAAPRKGHSSGSESVLEKNSLILQEMQTPVVQKKQPAVLREKKPPVLQEKKSSVLLERQPPVVREKQSSVVREKKPVLQEEKPPVLQEKKPSVLQEKNPPVLQEKRRARAPGSQATRKGLPHPGNGHTQQEGRPVLKDDRPLRALMPLSHETGNLPKEKGDLADGEVVLPPNSAGGRLQHVVEKLKLRRQATSQACGLVNKVVDYLQRRLPLCDPAFQGIARLGTGSYYEQVKISAPNEFDVMLKLEVSRIELEDYDDSGAFYFVKFKRNPKGNPLTSFLDNEILSASKLLSQFRKIIKAEVKHIEEVDIIVERKKPSSPAVTLLIRKPEEISVDIVLALESRSSWPPSTQEGLPIENWLGRKVKVEFKYRPVYLVPKSAKEGNGFQANTWRLSFSHIEKDILKNHGSSKTCCEKKNGVACCRKNCLKLMKYLLEQLKKKFENRKELDKFNSYHMKTAFFHLCAQKPNDSQWQSKDLEQCFANCVSYFLHCLQVEELAHFFIPRCNMFSRDCIGKTSQEFLLRQIEFQRNNMFPVFDE